MLSPSERDTLERYTRRTTTAQALALRARMVLHCAAREAHTPIAADLPVTKQTVGQVAAPLRRRAWRACWTNRIPGRRAA